jgi:hypothetical protein
MVKVSKRRFNLCSRGTQWEEEGFAFQPIFLIQTFALGLHRGRMGIGERYA